MSGNDQGRQLGFRALFLGKSEKGIVQFIRSMAASLLGFALDAGVLAALVELAGLHYLLANGISFLLGTTLVYLLSRSLVFPSTRFADQRLTYGLFLILAASGLLLNTLLLWALVDGLGIWYLAAKVIAACTVFLYNFACRKYLIFPGGKKPVS